MEHLQTLYILIHTKCCKKTEIFVCAFPVCWFGFVSHFICLLLTEVVNKVEQNNSIADRCGDKLQWTRCLTASDLGEGLRHRVLYAGQVVMHSSDYAEGHRDEYTTLE